MFVKFPSILYPKHVRPYRGLINAVKQWAVTEKIDGSNFSIIINVHDHSFEIGKRNMLINDPNGDIEDLWSNRARFNNLVDFVVDYYKRDTSIDHVILYGEFFGPKIMRRIDYGRTNDWRLFAMTAVRLSALPDYQYQTVPFKTLQSIVEQYSTKYNDVNRVVPVLSIVDKFDDAIAFPNDSKSTLSPSDSIMEGIVVVPYELGTNFRVKIKNSKYCEVDNNKARLVIDSDSNVVRLHEIFKTYCTENRMLSVFSKFGPCKDKSKVGEYLSEFLRDATEQFVSDYPEFLEITETSDRKKVTNVKSLPFMLFKRVSASYGA